MKISTIKVSNHSRIADCIIEARENLILVGPNGSGKSSIIRCLDLLLGKHMQQIYYSISKSDFINEKAPFIVEAKLTDLSDDELSFFPDEIETLDNSLTIRLEALIEDDEIAIRRFCPMGSNDKNLSTKQLQAIGWKLISSDFSSRFLSPTKRTIVDDYLKEIGALGNEEELSNAVNSLCKAIEDSSAFNTALTSLATQLNPALGGGVSVNNLHFIPGAAIDGNLLSDIRLQIKNQTGFTREATEQSDGTKALIAFAIFNLLNSGGIFAIDEPETHLHPSAQRNLMKILSTTNHQLIVATHSGVVAGTFNPDCIAVTHETKGVTQPVRGFLEDDQKALARWWISSRIELLTANSIIAVEGQSDRMVVSKVAELTSWNLSRDGIEILETEGCNDMSQVVKIFGKEGFNIHVSILIDEDAEGDMASTLGIERNALSSHSVFVSKADLEDEYVSAIGSHCLWDALKASPLFTSNQLNNCIINPDETYPSDSNLAAFCRKKKYKISSAIAACNLLNDTSAKKVSSVTNVLLDAFLDA